MTGFRSSVSSSKKLGTSVEEKPPQIKRQTREVSGQVGSQEIKVTNGFDAIPTLRGWVINTSS